MAFDGSFSPNLAAGLPKPGGFDLAAENRADAIRLQIRLIERLIRMFEANAVLSRWKPNQAAPDLLKLGFPKSEVHRLTNPPEGCAVGFSKEEIESVRVSIAGLGQHLLEQEHALWARG